MSVDMTKWQEIAKANIHKRPAGEGRLAGKITIVTGAAQGFGKGIAEELYKEGATIIIADTYCELTLPRIRRGASAFRCLPSIHRGGYPSEA